MAKVSAHGREVGTVYFTDSAKRYMSDGVILKNQACDGYGDNVSASVDEVAALCRAYLVALRESDDMRAETKAEPVS